MGKKRGVKSKRGSVTKRTAKKKPRKAPVRSTKPSKKQTRTRTAKTKKHTLKKTRPRTKQKASIRSTKPSKKHTRSEKSRKHPLKKKKTRTKRKEPLTIKKFIRKEHEVEQKIEEYLRPAHTVPLGIRLLIGYLTFLGILYMISFVYGITLPMTILLGQVISGAKALFINAMLVFLLFLMLYGFWRRKAYAFDLSLAWFGFSALNSFASLVLLDYTQYTVMKSFMLLSFVSMLLTSGVIMWYIHAERKYFYAKHFRGHRFEHQDKVFVYTIVTFWVLVLLVGGTMGARFMSVTKDMIDDSIPELRSTPTPLHEELCETKDQTERDVCLIVVATMRDTDDVEEIDDICDNVESDFYKFTCYKTLKR